MTRRWLLAALTAIVVAVPPSAASAAPGGLDPSFGHGGIVISNGFGTLGDAALQANGDILVVVNSSIGGSGVLRYLPTGALDPSFGNSGFAAISSSNLLLYGASGMAVQSDGEIIVSSSALTSNASQAGVAVARLNSNGSLDTRFGNGGVAFAAVAGGPSAQALLEEPNGDIVTGGSFLTATYRSDTTTGVVVRFTSTGQLDGTFGVGGVVSSTVLGGVQTLGVDAAGDLFALPATTELSPAGAIDPSVTPTPIVASSHGGPNAFLSSGESVRATTVGVFRGNNEVETRRFLATGAVDSSFPTSEFHYVAGQTARDAANTIAVQPNGDIVVGGVHWLGTAVFGLGRLTSGGVLDSTFGTAGTTTTSIQGDDAIGTLLAEPNNEIVAVGSTEDNSTGVSGVALARYFG